MTRLTRAEFEAYPSYDCSNPTFHENWLKPGRYWRQTAGNFGVKKNAIFCYVANSPVGADGCFDLGILGDEVEIIDDVVMAPAYAPLTPESKFAIPLLVELHKFAKTYLRYH